LTFFNIVVHGKSSKGEIFLVCYFFRAVILMVRYKVFGLGIGETGDDSQSDYTSALSKIWVENPGKILPPTNPINRSDVSLQLISKRE
jgi:hypothetical protein